MDTRLLKRAAAVLAASGRDFGSHAALKAWVERRQVRLFYYQSTSFELVCGFVPGEVSSQWRVAAVGWRGSYETSFLREGIAVVASIMRTSSISPLAISLLRMGPSDPMTQVYATAESIANTTPGVSLQISDQGNRRVYVATLGSEPTADSAVPSSQAR
jgi:hypothetical protein